MAKPKPACDGDTLLLDQMSCLIDWIGGYLPTARKRLRLDLFSEDKREGGQNEFVCMLHDDFAPGSVGAYQDRLMAATRAILATLQEVGKQLGYDEGRNLRIDFLQLGGADTDRSLAMTAELVGRGVDAIRVREDIGTCFCR
jgi:hypothetical protein